jgi:hypothetical protein
VKAMPSRTHAKSRADRRHPRPVGRQVARWSAMLS